MTPEGRRFWTIRQTADFLQINFKSCYAMAARGEIPFVRIGKRTIRIDARRLCEQLERQVAGKNVK